MRIVKWLLVGVAAIVVVLVVAVIVVPLVVPADTYKPRIVAMLKDATGRDVAINGPMSFSLVPSIGLEANNVSIANPPGAAGKTMAQFGKLQVQVKVLPLLHGDLEVDRLVLVDPVIALEVDKQGRPNWEFAAAKPAATIPAQPSSAASSVGRAGLSGLRLNDVRLVNGQISYVDDRTGAKQEVSEIGMKVSLPSLDGPFSADGSAVWRNEKITLVASLASPRVFIGGKSTAAAMKVQAKPISFDFKGEAAGSSPAKLDGTVDLQVPSVRGLAGWAGTPLSLPGTGFGPLAISGKVAMAGAKIDFSDANLSLDAIKAKGEVALDATGARPAAKGRLDVDKLDLNPYLPPEGESQGAAGEGKAGRPAAPQGKSAEWSDAPIDLSSLKSADMDFDISAGGLQYRKIQVGKSALGLHLKDGRFEADLTELALYQGAGKGKVVLDGSGAVPGVESEFDLDKVQVEPLLKDAAGIDRVSGVGALAFAVNGHGKSQRDIIAALDGKGNLDLANGAIKGIDVVAMAKNAAAALTGGGSAGEQQTPFGSLTGTYTITNGVLKNNDLQLTSQQVPMTGAGTVDILHRTVDYRLTPRVAGAAVPIVIKGPWDNLSYQPDLAALGTGKLLKQGEKALGGAKAPDVEGAIKGLLGGKK
jgi:AsmA protein